MRHAGLELLQCRTSQLEKENQELRSELHQLTESTETAEGREKDLVDNVVFELSEWPSRAGPGGGQEMATGWTPRQEGRQMDRVERFGAVYGVVDVGCRLI